MDAGSEYSHPQSDETVEGPATEDRMQLCGMTGKATVETPSTATLVSAASPKDSSSLPSAFPRSVSRAANIVLAGLGQPPTQLHSIPHSDARTGSTPLTSRRPSGHAEVIATSSPRTPPVRPRRSYSLPPGSREWNPATLALAKRLREFQKIFKQPHMRDAAFVEDYVCALQKEILIQGRLFITDRYVCFYSNLFGFTTSLVLNANEILSVEKKFTALIIPNAIQITTRDHKYFFTSFLSRDDAFHQISLARTASSVHDTTERPLNLPLSRPGASGRFGYHREQDRDGSSLGEEDSVSTFFSEERDEDGTDATHSDNEWDGPSSAPPRTADRSPHVDGDMNVDSGGHHDLHVDVDHPRRTDHHAASQETIRAVHVSRRNPLHARIPHGHAHGGQGHGHGHAHTNGIPHRGEDSTRARRDTNTDVDGRSSRRRDREQDATPQRTVTLSLPPVSIPVWVEYLLAVVAVASVVVMVQTAWQVQRTLGRVAVVEEAVVRVVEGLGRGV